MASDPTAGGAPAEMPVDPSDDNLDIPRKPEGVAGEVQQLQADMRAGREARLGRLGFTSGEAEAIAAQLGGAAVGHRVGRLATNTVEAVAAVHGVWLAGGSAVLIGLAGLAGSRVLKVPFMGTEIILGTVLTLLFLIIGRSTYRAWLGAARRSGRYTRDVVLVGANTEAACGDAFTSWRAALAEAG